MGGDVFLRLSQAHAVTHLRSANVVEIFEFVLADRRVFDPFRTRGKEDAVEQCLRLLREIRLAVCRILAAMSTASPPFRHLLINASLFKSPKITG